MAPARRRVEKTVFGHNSATDECHLRGRSNPLLEDVDMLDVSAAFVSVAAMSVVFVAVMFLLP